MKIGGVFKLPMKVCGVKVVSELYWDTEDYWYYMDDVECESRKKAKLVCLALNNYDKMVELLEDCSDLMMQSNDEDTLNVAEDVRVFLNQLSE